jgi:hypothetical protein
MRALTTPFIQWEAHKTGVIDAAGNILIPSKDRLSFDEKESFTKFDLLILKLKSILNKSSGGRARFMSYAAAAFLIREGESFDGDNDDISQIFESYTTGDNVHLTEEIVNTANAANLAGLDRGKHIASMSRFAGHDVFKVDTKRYLKSRFGKKRYKRWESYVGDDEVGTNIREYAKKFPKRPVILEDESTGAMLFLRYGKKGLFN